jgi:glycine cleavage system H protein
MSKVVQGFGYTKEHEWVEVVSATTVRFGITDYAQAALGDIVFVTLPAEGTVLVSGVACGEVESTKSVSDIYAPIDGTVTSVNSVAETSPEILNQDPYGKGWIAEVEVADAAAAVAKLMSADDYEAETLD